MMAAHTQSDPWEVFILNCEFEELDCMFDCLKENCQRVMHHNYPQCLCHVVFSPKVGHPVVRMVDEVLNVLGVYRADSEPFIHESYSKTYVVWRYLACDVDQIDDEAESSDETSSYYMEFFAV